MRERLVRHGDPEELAERLPPLRHGELEQLQRAEPAVEVSRQAVHIAPQRKGNILGALVALKVRTFSSSSRRAIPRTKHVCCIIKHM